MRRLDFRPVLLAAVLLVAPLAACETPTNVSVLQSDSVLVQPGATWAWAPVPDATRAAADPRISNDIVQDRLRTAVETNLSARGFRRVDNPNDAQLLASYHVGLRDRTETRVNTWGGGGAAACGFRGCVGGWGLYGPPQVDVRNINYTEGAMILDLIDRQSGRLAWRATSTRRVDANTVNQAQINTVVAAMTRSLPGPAMAAKN